MNSHTDRNNSPEGLYVAEFAKNSDVGAFDSWPPRRPHGLNPVSSEFFANSTMILLLITLLSLFSTSAFAVRAKIMLRNGEIQVVEVVSADDQGVWWQSGSIVEPRLLKHPQIAFVDFPEPANWQSALEAFYQGKTDAAATYFANIANGRKQQYYPAAGNYCSIAMLRLVDCYIATGKYDQIAKIAPHLAAPSLRVESRYRVPIIAAWAEFGKGNFAKAAQLAGAIKISGTSPGAAEIAFIKGSAFEKAGKNKEAIQSYAEVYSTDFGSDTAISRRALESSIRLLEYLGNEERAAELRALVHIYAHSFGTGDLYPNASSRAHEWLAKKLTFDEPVQKRKAKGKGTPASIFTIHLREGKITQVGKQRQFEFEPSLPPLGNAKVKKGELAKTVRIPKIRPGVSLQIAALGASASRGIGFDPDRGLGVINANEEKSNSAINEAVQGLRFTVVGKGASGVRVVSVTMGSRTPSHTWESGDEATVLIKGLKKGEPGYEVALTAKTKAEDFKVIKFNGGYLETTTGKFEFTHESGSFAIDRITIELESNTRDENQ